MAHLKRHNELVVITKTYDLIFWSCNHTGKFPRKHRFVLGERIETCKRSCPRHWRRSLLQGVSGPGLQNGQLINLLQEGVHGFFVVR